jgi:outer membrane protein
VSAAEVNLARAKADYGPRLIGEVGVSAEDDGAQYSSVDLTLSQTLYRGGGLYAAERQARADVQQSRAVLLQTVRTVEQGVGNAWAGLAVARAQVDATATQVQASQLAFEGTVEEARLGARTTLDVLDAEQDVLDARTAQIQAQADQYTAVYAILASVGLLTADHLGLGIPTYDPRAYYNAVSHAPAKSVQGRRLDKVLDRIGRE